LPDAINYLLGVVEASVGVAVARTTLSLLTCSKEGLSQLELEDILSLDGLLEASYEYWQFVVARIPPLIVARLLDSLEEFLVIHQSVAGTGVRSFYHRAFR
jgi:hypothetical protein